MCHISGFGFLPASGEFARINYTIDHTLAEAVRAYAGEKLISEPGTKYVYSNMGVATLGRIVEVLSGQKYEDFVQSRILTPLGMKDSFFFPPEDKKSRIAMVYTPDGAKEAGPGARPGSGRRSRQVPVRRQVPWTGTGPVLHRGRPFQLLSDAGQPGDVRRQAHPLAPGRGSDGARLYP